MKLFGTDGIRGRANDYPITAEVALRVGRAVARLLAGAGGTVVIGRDPRVSGSMLEAAVTAGLLASGTHVVQAGVVPTPAVAYLTRSTSAAAGIMLTASHNPHEDNGLKIFGGTGFKLDDALEAAVEEFILGPQAPPSAELGRLSVLTDGAAPYLAALKSAAAGLSLRGMTLVVDAANGAAHAIAPGIFEQLGARVIATATRPDGLNINAGCGALHPEHAAALVREHGADLGISLDGDADRVIFTDASGAVVSGDRVLALGALALKERGELTGDAMVCTVMSNLGLHEAMAAAGITVVTTGVGDRLVIEALRAEGYSFGGENSGHLIFAAHATTGDGILSALQILRMMREKSATLAELASCMREYPQQLLSLAVNSKPPLESLPTLQAASAAADAAFGTLGRHNIRYSGTEAKIRILIEHRDAAMVEKWAQCFTQAVGQDIGIPH
jgi:phosphoglucosamine mutase